MKVGDNGILLHITYFKESTGLVVLLLHRCLTKLEMTILTLMMFLTPEEVSEVVQELLGNCLVLQSMTSAMVVLL